MVNIPRWQIVLVLVVVLFGILFAAPNLIGRERAESLPDWMPHKQINLGLDLQGGSYLLLEADIEAVIAERLENEADALRRELRSANIGYQGGIQVRAWNACGFAVGQARHGAADGRGDAAGRAAGAAVHQAFWNWRVAHKT